MAQFKLVMLPLILTLVFVVIAIGILSWRKKKLEGINVLPQGSNSILVLAVSFFILAGFTLFTGLFFLITG